MMCVMMHNWLTRPLNYAWEKSLTLNFALFIFCQFCAIMLWLWAPLISTMLN